MNGEGETVENLAILNLSRTVTRAENDVLLLKRSENLLDQILQFAPFMLQNCKNQFKNLKLDQAALESLIMRKLPKLTKD